MAIVGRPNAGKSSLLNALLKQKLSIVTAKAQTTRHRVLGILSEPEFQLICLDTPGIMQVRTAFCPLAHRLAFASAACNLSHCSMTKCSVTQGRKEQAG